MFRARQKRGNAANQAILQTSRLFSKLWGDAELAENGDVHFTDLPSTLQGLTAIQTWQRQLLGGTMTVNLCLERRTDWTERSVLRFSSGKFKCKGGSGMSQRLMNQLHADAALMSELRRLDLGGLTISLSDGKATVTLTPYGGGLAFLALPPCSIPLPIPRIRSTSPPACLSAWSRSSIAKRKTSPTALPTSGRRMQTRLLNKESCPPMRIDPEHSVISYVR